MSSSLGRSRNLIQFLDTVVAFHRVLSILTKCSLTSTKWLRLRAAATPFWNWSIWIWNHHWNREKISCTWRLSWKASDAKNWTNLTKKIENSSKSSLIKTLTRLILCMLFLMKWRHLQSRRWGTERIRSAKQMMERIKDLLAMPCLTNQSAATSSMMSLLKICKCTSRDQAASSFKWNSKRCNGVHN